jgi:hypothetical protein
MTDPESFRAGWLQAQAAAIDIVDDYRKGTTSYGIPLRHAIARIRDLTPPRVPLYGAFKGVESTVLVSATPPDPAPQTVAVAAPLPYDDEDEALANGEHTAIHKLRVKLAAMTAERDRFAHEASELRSTVGSLKAHLSATMKKLEGRDR